jgi:hypothetical protein
MEYASMQNVTGVSGGTVVAGGVYITTPDMHFKVPADMLQQHDGIVYFCIRSDYRIAALCGGTSENGHGKLDQNSFIKELRQRRHDATTALMETVHLRNPEYGGGKLVRKVLIDEVPKVAEVTLDGFKHRDGDVAGCNMRVMTALYYHSPPWVELNPTNFEFVRKGIQHAMNVDQPAKRRSRDHRDFEAHPNARLSPKGFVFASTRNQDGKICMKTFPVKFTENAAILHERRVDAAHLAQCHFDSHNVPKIKRARKSSACGSNDVPPEVDEDDCADEVNDDGEHDSALVDNALVDDVVSILDEHVSSSSTVAEAIVYK